jgi:hypothetical protein
VNDEHDWVRRLLAEAGQESPRVPADVADRLDRVLGELAQEGGSDGPLVVPIAPRRRRRWAAALLSAAAITVGGYSVAATGVLDDLAGGADSAESVDSVDSADSAESAAAGDQTPERRAREGAAVAGSPSVPALSSGSLRQDARRLVRDVLPATTPRNQPGTTAGPSETGDALVQPRGGRCVPPPPGVAGLRRAVVLDGAPATAVVRPSVGGRALVQVWSCDSPVRLARVVVPR